MFVSKRKTQELDARLTIAELGGWPWSRYTQASVSERSALLASITGSLASFGEMARAIQLCKTLNLTPEAVSIAQKRGNCSMEDLQPFLNGNYGAGWTSWAQGKGKRRQEERFVLV